MRILHTPLSKIKTKQFPQTTHLETCSLISTFGEVGKELKEREGRGETLQHV